MFDSKDLAKFLLEKPALDKPGQKYMDSKCIS